MSQDNDAESVSVSNNYSFEKKKLDELVDQAILSSDVDVTNCDREPIHVPNAIQPHGILIVFDPQTLKILQISKNFDQWTGFPLDSLAGSSLHSIFGSDSVQTLLQILSDPAVTSKRQLFLELSQNKADSTLSCICQLHVEPNICCLEMEKVNRAVLGYFDFYQQLKAPIKRIQQTENFRELCDRTVEEIKAITGYDRVLIYKFLHDDSGSVIAEAVEQDVPSFLGLRYPATDIPLQARILYGLNLLRIIPDVSYAPIPLVDCSPNLPYDRLDMSLIGVRSVSPIHLEYLKNMGVAGSFSISIMCDGQLWGLIACHHQQPKNISLNIRSCCEFIGQIMSSELILKEKNDDLTDQNNQQSLLQHFCSDMLAAESLEQLFQQKHSVIMKIVNSTGLVLIEQQKISSFGVVPDDDEVLSLYNSIEENYSDQLVFHSDNISEALQGIDLSASGVAGFLGLLISRPHKIAVIWFRPEVKETINWAGNPQKQEQIDDSGERYLSPRQSFALWQETVKGFSSPWTQADIDAIDQMRNGMVGIFLKKLSDLSDLNLALTQSNDDLSSLAYAASHDLKSPLRSISHLASWLQEDLNEHLNEETTGYIHEILDSVARMNNVIAALLKFFEVGNIGESLETISISQLISDAIQFLSPPPSIQITYPQDTRLYTLDKRLLSQILINLLDNACKYIDRPDGKILINCYPETTHLAFEVIDNGPGIDPSMHTKIFEMFSALERQRGTGMGLAIVKKLVQKQGGQIDLVSSLGEGCNFRFTWPLDD